MPRYRVEVVIFDCDSTLSAIEGIDELARRAGLHDQLAPLTAAAMEGRMSLDEVYRRRLELVRPSRAELEWLGRRYVETLVPDAAAVMTALLAAGKQVHIVSGGLRPAVLAAGRRLAIADDHVHAVDIQFGTSGAYAGFDTASPLAANGGKKIVCGRIAADRNGAVLVGDAITDLEAAQPGVHVIGFGGVVRRDAVALAAEEFLEGPSLLPLLDLID
jgi:phosphoserine phosphatase